MKELQIKSWNHDPRSRWSISADLPNFTIPFLHLTVSGISTINHKCNILVWNPVLSLKRLRRTHWWCKEFKRVNLNVTVIIRLWLYNGWQTGLYVNLTKGLIRLSACMRDGLSCHILGTATHIVYRLMHFSLHAAFLNASVIHSCLSVSLGSQDLRELKSLLWNGLILAYSQLISSVDSQSFLDNP